MRKTDRLNDYITRREAHALIVRVLSEMFAEPAEPEVRMLTPLEDQSGPPAEDLTTCGHHRDYACHNCASRKTFPLADIKAFGREFIADGVRHAIISVDEAAGTVTGTPCA